MKVSSYHDWDMEGVSTLSKYNNPTSSWSLSSCSMHHEYYIPVESPSASSSQFPATNTVAFTFVQKKPRPVYY